MADTWTLEVTANLDNLKQVRDFVEDKARLSGLCQEKLGELLLAVDEIISNIIMHAYSGLTDGNIEITFINDNQQCTLEIVDHAPLHNPLNTAAPDLSCSPMDNDEPGGYGLTLIKSMVDTISYQVTPDNKNKLLLTKHF